MVIDVAAKTDIGCQRDKNEDSFHVDKDDGLYIICDGMGGHLAGEVASRKAIEFTVSFLARARSQRILPRRSDIDFPEIWTRLVEEAIEFCCDELLSFAKLHPELEGMATTITVLMIVEGVAFVGHLGDSRLYLKNGNVAKQLTSDHTLLAEFARANPNWVNSNNDDEAIKRYGHILTRCVGRAREFSVEAFNFRLADQDVLLLCTDGLSNYLDDESLIVEFLNEANTVNAVHSLVDFANSHGGNDNITAIVIRVVSIDNSQVLARALDSQAPRSIEKR